MEIPFFCIVDIGQNLCAIIVIYCVCISSSDSGWKHILIGKEHTFELLFNKYNADFHLW